MFEFDQDFALGSSEEYSHEAQQTHNRATMELRMDITGLSKGKHLFECCIHPWMRMEVDVK